MEHVGISFFKSAMAILILAALGALGSAEAHPLSQVAVSNVVNYFNDECINIT